MNKLKGFKTVAFNVIMAVGILAGANLDPELVTNNVEALALLWSTGNVLLRAVTNSKIFKRES